VQPDAARDQHSETVGHNRSDAAGRMARRAGRCSTSLQAWDLHRSSLCKTGYAYLVQVGPVIGSHYVRQTLYDVSSYADAETCLDLLTYPARGKLAEVATRRGCARAWDIRTPSGRGADAG